MQICTHACTHAIVILFACGCTFQIVCDFPVEVIDHKFMCERAQLTAQWQSIETAKWKVSHVYVPQEKTGTNWYQNVEGKTPLWWEKWRLWISSQQPLSGNVLWTRRRRQLGRKYIMALHEMDSCVTGISLPYPVSLFSQHIRVLEPQTKRRGRQERKCGVHRSINFIK